MARETSTVVDGFTFTEAPRWHEGRLWFSDLYTYQVLSVAEDGSDLKLEAEIPGQPAGMDWLPDGRLLVVSMLDRKVMRREHDGRLVVHADLSGSVPWTLNDLVADTAGRAYVGNFGFDLFGDDPLTPARLTRVDPDGSSVEAADDLWFPNGSVVTPVGDLLVNESFGNRISAFRIAADGSLAGRRTWARFGPLPPRTDLDAAARLIVLGCDGAALDAAGALWVADCLHERVVRVLEGGEITDDIRLGTGVYGCALGGSAGRTLFLCVAPDFDRERRRETRESSVLAIPVGIPAPAQPQLAS